MASNRKSRKYKNNNNSQPNSEAKMKTEDISSDLIMEKLKGLGLGEKKADQSPDTSDIGIFINKLVTAVQILRHKVEDLESKSATSDEGMRISDEGIRISDEGIRISDEGIRISDEGMRNREANDESDGMKQCQLKDSILLTCSQSDISSPSLIKSDEELGSCPLIYYVTDIINIKYKVLREDVKACQHLPSESIIIKVWRRKNASPWQSLINSICTGGDKNINCYLNIHLTKTQNNLLYAVRQLKKKSIINTFGNDKMLTRK